MLISWFIQTKKVILIAKTQLTKDIEKALIDRFYFKIKKGSKSEGLGHRFAFECTVYNSKPKKNGSTLGRVDFISKLTNQDIFYCTEIKISKSDFKSENGHNLIGHFNYYAVPLELAEWVKDNCEKHIGILSYDSGKLSVYKKPTRVKKPYIDGQLKLVKKNMLTACNSTIRRILNE